MAFAPKYRRKAFYEEKRIFGGRAAGKETQ